MGLFEKEFLKHASVVGMAAKGLRGATNMATHIPKGFTGTVQRSIPVRAAPGFIPQSAIKSFPKTNMQRPFNVVKPGATPGATPGAAKVAPNPGSFQSPRGPGTTPVNIQGKPGVKPNTVSAKNFSGTVPKSRTFDTRTKMNNATPRTMNMKGFVSSAKPVDSIPLKGGLKDISQGGYKPNYMTGQESQAQRSIWDKHKNKIIAGTALTVGGITAATLFGSKAQPSPDAQWVQPTQYGY